MTHSSPGAGDVPGGAPLAEVLPFLVGLGRTGRLSDSSGARPDDQRPAFNVWMEQGRVVDVVWGGLRDLAALDMAAVFLPRANFHFSEGVAPPSRGLDLEPAALSERLGEVASQAGALTAWIPSPLAVPARVDNAPAAPPTGPETAVPTGADLARPRGAETGLSASAETAAPAGAETARLLAEIDGRTSVADLVGARPPLVVLGALASLAQAGAITFESSATGAVTTARIGAAPQAAAPAATGAGAEPAPPPASASSPASSSSPSPSPSPPASSPVSAPSPVPPPVTTQRSVPAPPPPPPPAPELAAPAPEARPAPEQPPAPAPASAPQAAPHASAPAATPDTSARAAAASEREHALGAPDAAPEPAPQLVAPELAASELGAAGLAGPDRAAPERAATSPALKPAAPEPAALEPAGPELAAAAPALQPAALEPASASGAQVAPPPSRVQRALVRQALPVQQPGRRRLPPVPSIAALLVLAVVVIGLGARMLLPSTAPATAPSGSVAPAAGSTGVPAAAAAGPTEVPTSEVNAQAVGTRVAAAIAAAGSNAQPAAGSNAQPAAGSNAQATAGSSAQAAAGTSAQAAGGSNAQATATAGSTGQPASSATQNAGPAAAPSTVAAAAPSPSPALVLALDTTFATGAPGWPNSVASSAWWDTDGYHLVPRIAGQHVAITAPGSPTLQDQLVQATFLKTGGPSGGGSGVVVRAQAPLDGGNQGGRYYVFEAGDRGEFGIWRREQDQWVELRPWTSSSAVRPGLAENTLQVRAQGTQFTFLVNDVQVAQVSDTQLTSGASGVFTGGDGNQIRLERFTIARL